MQALWPYHTYRPVTWDRYYVNEHHDKQVPMNSGIAAGVTIAIFLLVFVFTFGCRIYSQYADRTQSQNPRSQESGLSESLAEDMWVCGVPRGPPPPYEVAIKMSASPPNTNAV
ncbi:hypothetical protein KIN20_031498 [Parelaphostrongylus tenuis]|uniref:Uncharacterized protein n=1 Tax=Parelaphostrongylus tenuis TaxID=148309 RepID=A0AAD5WHA8_PARTN|nr:hypothetical protein KIN20_031498 [Parelaphostrongylus tenuis]